MPLDVDEGALSGELHDAPLHGELVLLAEMVVAASESTTPLTQDQIDQVLFKPHIVRQRQAE